MRNAPQDHQAGPKGSTQENASCGNVLLTPRAALTCATICWAIFAILAGLVSSGRHADMDNLGLLLFRSPSGLDLRGPSWGADLTRGITALGGVVLRNLLAASAVAMLLLFGLKRHAAILFATIASGWMIGALLKQSFARPRPDTVPHLMTVDGYSFPSGHSFNAAVIYISLGIVLGSISPRQKVRGALLVTGLLISILVSASRVMLGVHYPSDVIAGWMAGVGWALLASAWLNILLHTPGCEFRQQGAKGTASGTAGLSEHLATGDFLMADENPKSHPTDNAEKDPDTWVSGEDPMTGAQASYLKTLSEQADEPEAFSENISKAEASKRVDALKAKLDLG